MKNIKNLPLSNTTSYGLLIACQNILKANDPVPRKCLDRETNIQKDGHTLFYRTLAALTGNPKNAVKVKRNSLSGKTFSVLSHLLKKNTYPPFTACGPYLSLKILDLKIILIILKL